MYETSKLIPVKLHLRQWENKSKLVQNQLKDELGQQKNSHLMNKELY